MASPPAPPRSSLDRAGALQRLLHELDRAADVMSTDPEAFLWRARRSAELWCLIHWPDDQSPEQISLDQMIESLDKRKIIREAQKVALQSLRSSGNPGVHARVNDPADQRRFARLACPALLSLLEDPLPGLSEADKLRLQQIGEELRREGRPEPRNLRAEQLQLQVQALQEELVAQQAAQRSLAAEREQLQSDLIRLQAELQARPGVAEAPPSSAGSPRAWALPAAALGLGALGLGALALLGLAGWTWQGARVPDLDSAPSAELQAMHISASQGAEASPPDRKAAPVELRPSCPSGMLLFPASSLSLGQPERPTWPKARREGVAPVDVPSFCLDIAPATWTELAPLHRTREAITCAERWWQSDLGQKANRQGPGGCVTLTEARQHCEGRGARLPSIAQWEAAQRMERGRVQGGIYREWVEDSFPPRIFHREGPTTAGMFRQPLRSEERATQGVVLWSWNQQAPESRISNLGLRCAMEPRHSPTPQAGGAEAPAPAPHP